MEYYSYSSREKMMLSNYEQTILNGWEEVYKKGQLTLWVLIALKNGPKHMAEIKDYISESTEQVMQVDDKSMYRALRRFAEAELVSFRSVPSQSGPDRKIYSLTRIGENLLKEFIRRNITVPYRKAGIIHR